MPFSGPSFLFQTRFIKLFSSKNPIRFLKKKNEKENEIFLCHVEPYLNQFKKRLLSLCWSLLILWFFLYACVCNFNHMDCTTFHGAMNQIWFLLYIVTLKKKRNHKENQPFILNECFYVSIANYWLKKNCAINHIPYKIVSTDVTVNALISLLTNKC